MSVRARLEDGIEVQRWQTCTVTNAYDGMGQLTQTSSGGRLLRYTYDAVFKPRRS